MKEEIKILMNLGLNELFAVELCKDIAFKAYNAGLKEGIYPENQIFINSFNDWFNNQIIQSHIPGPEDTLSTLKTMTQYTTEELKQLYSIYSDELDNMFIESWLEGTEQITSYIFVTKFLIWLESEDKHYLLNNKTYDNRGNT